MLRELRSADQEKLITNYDERIVAFQEGLPSNVGTYVRPTEPKIGSVLIFAVKNAGRVPLPPDGKGQEIDYLTGRPFVPNHLLSYLDIAQYYNDHKYLEESFRKKYGFGLKELCVAAYAISAVLISASSSSFAGDAELKERFSLHNKLQRGYISPGLEKTGLKEAALRFLNEGNIDAAFAGHSIDGQIDEVMDFLTLYVSKQKLIGLWSLGPQFVLIPYGQKYFFNVTGWLQIFRNLFFGLKKYDLLNKKGAEFEYSFAEYARENSLEVTMESMEIVLGNQPREVDVAIRVGARLFVCECRAQERPLDFEIGNPKTIQARNDDLAQKVDQVISLARLFEMHPLGSNYDISWAEQIVPIVVSPYVEWIWSLDDELWISKVPSLPRIMSAPEAISYIRQFSNVAECQSA